MTVKGLTSRVPKQFIQLNIKEAKNPDLNRHFSKEDTSPMAKKHVKRRLASPVITLVLGCADSVTLWTIACRVLWPLNFSSKNTGVGCHFLFQEIFPTQGLNVASFALADGFLTTAPPGKLIIREMQIKTTVRCLLTLVRMAFIKKSTNNKCWRTSLVV